MTITPGNAKAVPNPQPGEVYKASPRTSVNGDRHGKTMTRPVGVVERLPRVAMCLGRSTHPEKDARTLDSAKNLSIGLTEDAAWQDRFQRPVPRSFWGTPDFTYAGRLPTQEASDLLQFWAMTTLLGRKGL